MKKVLDLIKRHSIEAIVLFALLLVGALSFVFIKLFSSTGNTVTVTVDGEIFGEYSLYVDAVYEIGEGNILTVKGGVAFMSYADCPDKTCKNMGKISKTGEKIICLPNRVSAEIRD